MAVVRPRLTPAQALTASKEDIDNEMRCLRDVHTATIEDPVALDEGVNMIYEDLLKSVILGFVFDFHRQLKTGEQDLLAGLRDLVTDDHKIVDEIGLDIFGQPPIKKPPDCECPECHRNLTAARFAPHLEKCMGMGRNSSRLAQRRIANNSTTAVAGEDATDDVDDADWTMGSDRRRNKKKEKTGTKRIKTQKTSRNGTSNHTELSTTSTETNESYEGMRIDNKREMLLHICGVISEHTKRLCTRSMRCPQHSDDQRRAVRASLLARSSDPGSESNSDPVDVDTYEEGDAQTVRDTLGRHWEQENSNASSPADSCSTGSSTQSSKKKDKSLKSKMKAMKRSHHGHTHVD